MNAQAKHSPDWWIAVDAEGGQVGGYHLTRRDAERSIPASEREQFKFLCIDSAMAIADYDDAKATGEA